MRTTCVQARLSAIRDWETLAKQADYRVSGLARIVNAGRKTLERFFRSRFGKGPQVWLDASRQREIEKLLQSELLLKEVAFAVGYKQQSHMSRQFKETHNGITPLQWRKLVAAQREVHRRPRQACLPHKRQETPL